MSVIDEVKQKTDILETIGQYATLTKAGNNFRALCPFHNETRPSFMVYPEQQSWHCFGACSTGGDVFSFIMKQENMDFGESLRLLAEKVGVAIPTRSESAAGKDKRDRVFQTNEAASRYFHNLLLKDKSGEKARHYLDERNFSTETISDFQLGYSLDNWDSLKQYLMEQDYTENELLDAGLIVKSDDGKTHDRFRNRLIFPINDNRERIIGFGARALDDSMPKYLNSPQTSVFDKSGSLYGINRAAAAIRQQDRAIMVEGYVDAITAHQNEFNNVVAAMGTAITERQLLILKRLTKNMVLALDADSAGEAAMLRCVGYENALATEVKVVILPPGKDPDDIIKEDSGTWQRLLDEALPVIDYTLNMVTARLDMTTANGKAQAVEQLIPIITEIKDSTRQDHYLTRLAQLTGIGYRSLETTLKNFMLAQKSKNPLRQGAITQATKSLRSSPLEEDFLSLLLNHLELKEKSSNLLPEYFESSQNREIFLAWQQTDDLPSLKDKLDTIIHAHLEILSNKNLPPMDSEQRYDDYASNLLKRFNQNLAERLSEVLASEAEAGGTAAELAKLKEEGLEHINQLRDIFHSKARRGQR